MDVLFVCGVCIDYSAVRSIYRVLLANSAVIEITGKSLI